MAMKMTSFARTGITPDIAGADLPYALKLQYNRWKAKNLRVTMEVTPSDVGKPQVPVAGLMGAFIGLMCGGFAFLGYAIYKAIQGISEVGGSKSAERKIERKIQAFDSAFSYKLFEGQLLSFLKMALFTEEPGNLACFEGTSIPERYRDLVDMSYHGTIALKGIETDGDTVKMNLGVFLRDTYYVNNHIKIKDEEIRLQVARKRSARTDAGFSIKKVECKACGGSFDASHQRICPYCHNAYDMKEQNWVITRIEK